MITAPGKRRGSLAEQLHVAGEHDQARAALLAASRRARGRAARAVGVVRAREHRASGCRPVGGSASAAARRCSSDRHDLGLVAVDLVDQGLQVGARARDEHGDGKALGDQRGPVTIAVTQAHSGRRRNGRQTDRGGGRGRCMSDHRKTRRRRMLPAIVPHASCFSWASRRPARAAAAGRISRAAL